MTTKTIILGAGLAGIGAARNVSEPVVYEAKDHPGGHVYSHQQGGLFFDEGAHICHAKDDAWKHELFANAGEVAHVPQSLVSNWWHGRWVTYPVQNHLRDLPVELRIRALTEIVAAQMKTPERPAAHYEEWCRNQYGDFLTERFYREYTDKYWRTPMAEMDTDWLAGRLLPSQLERIIHGAIAPLDEKQSVFSSFHYPASGGFFAFFSRFYEGIDVRLNKKVITVDPQARVVRFADGDQATFDKLISTIPLNDLVRAIASTPDSIRRDADSLRHTQMIGVNMVINKPNLVPHHWFYIYDPDIEVSRVKVLSNVIPGSVPPGTTVLQTEIFRRDDELFDPAALAGRAVEELGPVLGYDPQMDVTSVHHVVVSHSYTIPTLGRQAAVDRIADWLEGKGIITAGLYGRWKYVWSDQAYASGVEAAGKVLSA